MIQQLCVSILEARVVREGAGIEDEVSPGWKISSLDWVTRRHQKWQWVTCVCEEATDTRAVQPIQ
ncbi:hypothetical protein J1614_005727 [Plenodomus biglobosus]|nr:hypothetical protein J1614_005727 [Plenodomus biglobosus]